MSFLVFNWLLSVGYLLHPFFISMTDLNHNVKDQTVEISVRIFTDDFENVLRKTCQCKVALVKPAEKGAMENLVSEYITKHLQLKVNGKSVILQFAGYQQEGGSTWSYFEVKNIPIIHAVELTNSLLYDLNEEQINMLHFKVNGKDKTDKLEFPKKDYSATF